MLLLIANTTLNGGQAGRTDAERGVAVLPGKLRKIEVLADTFCRRLLQLSHEIGQAMRCLQLYQQMNAVRDAAATLRDRGELFQRSPQIFVES